MLNLDFLSSRFRGGLRGQVAGTLLGIVGACRSTSPPVPAIPVLAPVPIRSVAEMPGDFQWRQTVTVMYRDQKPRSFDAVLEKQGNVLSLVGLTPVQTILFVARAVGTSVEFENRTGQWLPFGGSHILRDVQRAYYPWLSGSCDEGRRSRSFGEGSVEELCRSGRVVERVFEQAGKPAVRVAYRDRARFTDGPPGVVTLVDEQNEYRLEIETLEVH